MKQEIEISVHITADNVNTQGQFVKMLKYFKTLLNEPLLHVAIGDFILTAQMYPNEYFQNWEDSSKVNIWFNDIIYKDVTVYSEQQDLFWHNEVEGMFITPDYKTALEKAGFTNIEIQDNSTYETEEEIIKRYLNNENR